MEQYKQDNDELFIQNQSLSCNIKVLEENIEELDKNIDALRKKLTIDDSKYDSIGIPKLNIKQLKDTLKVSDKYTLGRVVELLRIDYTDMVIALSNSLEDINKYEISISMNAIRRRYQVLIDVLGGFTTESSYIDRGTGEIKLVTKK